jgi:hypothetical protein
MTPRFEKSCSAPRLAGAHLDEILTGSDEASDAIDRGGENIDRNAMLAHGGDAGVAKDVNRDPIAPSSCVRL